MWLEHQVVSSAVPGQAGAVQASLTGGLPVDSLAKAQEQQVHIPDMHLHPCSLDGY